jgi:ectonucleoside triphosphate diphosphohydrolase 5/6
MENVRRRSNRGPGPRGDSGSPVKRRRTKSANVDNGFTTVIMVAAVLIAGAVAVFFLVPGLKDQFMDKLGLGQERLHAVVIDAGSTGSRVLGFKFHRGAAADASLKLDDELWVQDKPGLSSYADNPRAAAHSIERLLKKAKEFIPQSGWSSTPITLRATAGLRLLPKDQSDAIIAEVEKVLRSSGFKPEEPLVEIMNPMEEGLFAWFTVNFLLNQFSQGDVSKSTATLDLGGGSTQVVFVPGRRVEGLEGRKHYMHNVTVMKENHALYSHSYLGLGLMTARKSMFKIGAANGNRVASPCVSSKTPLTFKFQGTEYTIERSANPSAEACLELANAAVAAENVHAPKELAERHIAAFSYFYDEVAERGVVPEVVGGVITVGDYKREATKACSEDDSEFFCADLSFVYAMLSRGYGLADNKEITVFKKIDGHEASWALGCAYNILEG